MTNAPHERDDEHSSQRRGDSPGDGAQPHARFGPDTPNQWGEPATPGQPPVTGPIPVPPPPAASPGYNAPTVIPVGREAPPAFGPVPAQPYVPPPPFVPGFDPVAVQPAAEDGGFPPYSAALPVGVSAGRPRRRWPLILSIAGIVVLLIAGGAAYAVERLLASSGTQPERVLPATTVAFAKIDLDPAADQKIAAFRLARHFPSLKSSFTTSGDVTDSALGSLFSGSTDLDYTTDIKPWLGRRAAVAAVPTGRTAEPVLAAAYTDRAKMTAALKKAQARGGAFGWTVSGDYVLISDTTAHAADVARQAATRSLDHNSTFSSDVHALDGNQVAEIWVDFGALKNLSQSVNGSSLFGGLATGGLATGSNGGVSGRLVAGVHVSSDYLDLNGLIRGAAGNATAKASMNTIEQLPATTSAAIEIGLGDGVAASLSTIPAASQDQLKSTFRGLGLSYPGDLLSILGTDMTAAVHITGSSAASFAVQTQTADPAGAVSAIKSILAHTGSSSTILAQPTRNGYLLFNDPGYSSSIVSHTAPPLGKDTTFLKAVPDAAGASVVGFVNIGAIVDAGVKLGSTDKADLKHVAAVGLTESANRFRVRLTVR